MLFKNSLPDNLALIWSIWPQSTVHDNARHVPIHGPCHPCVCGALTLSPCLPCVCGAMTLSPCPTPTHTWHLFMTMPDMCHDTAPAIPVSVEP